MANKKPKNETSKSEQERLQLKADLKKWGRRQRKIEEQEAKEQAKQKAKDLEAKLRYLSSGNAVYKSREKDFKSFKKKYELTEEGKSIQDILLGFTGATAENCDLLKKQVLYVIYQFKNYDPDRDNFSLLRDNRKNGHKKIDKWIRAAKSLQELHEQYPFQRLYVDLEVQKQLASKKVSVDEKVPVKDLTLKYIDAIKTGLEKYKAVFKNLSDLSGGWLAAGIYYPPQKPDGKPSRMPPAPNKASLFLHLVKIFRHYTANKPDLGWVGAPMPEIGKPCYGTVASIATVVLGTEEVITERAVSEEVKRLVNSGVTLHSWSLPSK